MQHATRAIALRARRERAKIKTVEERRECQRGKPITDEDAYADQKRRFERDLQYDKSWLHAERLQETQFARTLEHGHQLRIDDTDGHQREHDRREDDLLA